MFYFEQEDLCDEDVMLLDCYTTLFLWVGSQAHSDEKKKVNENVVVCVVTCPDVIGGNMCCLFVSFLSL